MTESEAPTESEAQSKRTARLNLGFRILIQFVLLGCVAVVLLVGQGHGLRFNLLPYALSGAIVLLSVVEWGRYLAARRRPDLFVAEELNQADAQGGRDSERIRTIWLTVWIVSVSLGLWLFPIAMVLGGFLVLALWRGAHWPLWRAAVTGILTFAIIEYGIIEALQLTTIRPVFDVPL